ncbi:MAG: transketolase C-terminal domain-containing protein [Dehalococcoidia bacterium]
MRGQIPRLLRAAGPVPEKAYTLPLDSAQVVREGSDITIIGVSWLMGVCLEVAETLAQEGISAEVIDLVSLAPLDEETLLRSLSKTGRLLVVDQDHPRCGIARDVAAVVVEKGFDYLDAPIMTVTPPAVPEPFGPHLSERYYPDAAKVLAKAREILA